MEPEKPLSDSGPPTNTVSQELSSTGHILPPSDAQPEPTVIPDESTQASPSTNIQVFQPAPTPSAQPSDTNVSPDETFFEPTLSDAQAHHASVLARSKRLNEAPLLTSKYRDAEKAEKEKKKADKWPTTTIRIKFSDGTQIQNVFPSNSPIQPVYAFVRSSLDPEASSKPFTLWQPPRYQYPEKPPPSTKKPNPHRTTIVTASNYGPVRGGPTQGLQSGTGGKETLADLGLVPQSVLVVRWEDEEMNSSGYRAPLLSELMKKSVPLPATVPKEPEQAKSSTQGNNGPKPGEKKIPKWLQKGLMKRK